MSDSLYITAYSKEEFEANPNHQALLAGERDYSYWFDSNEKTLWISPRIWFFWPHYSDKDYSVQCHFLLDKDKLLEAIPKARAWVQDPEEYEPDEDGVNWVLEYFAELESALKTLDESTPYLIGYIV